MFSVLVVISLVGTISGKRYYCCHQMSYFKAKMHQIRFLLGLLPRPRSGSLQRSPDVLAGFKRAYFYGEGRERKRREMGGEGNGLRGGEVEERWSTWPGPTFSLFYTTPLLQHQVRFGLNPVSRNILTPEIN